MENWKIGRNVSLTIVLALVVQFMTFVTYMADLDNGVHTNAKDISQHNDRLISLEASVQSQAISLARIDENIRHIRVAVDRVLEGSE
ncbi:MAG: hypothetical protein NZ730_06530 [Porticoccaceae bacterium]|nr:hypothetical protein [Porticoccaceae bacterium]